MSSLNDLSIIERPLHSATTQMVHNKHLQTSDPNYPDLKFLHLTTKLRVFNNHQMVSLHNISFRVHTSTVKLHLGSQRTQVLKILKSWTVPENAGHRIGGLSMPHLSPPIVWHSFTNFTKKKRIYTRTYFRYSFTLYYYTLPLHFSFTLYPALCYSFMVECIPSKEDGVDVNLEAVSLAI